MRDPMGPQKRIAILTSGGDSQGMNAALRAIVRCAYTEDMVPVVVYDGYQGLVDGRMETVEWDHVQGLLAVGGTVIGSARCQAFRQRPGRKVAACNLVKGGIDALIVIGGDGSLTGADLFRSEWPSLLVELREEGSITEEEQSKCSSLAVVGLVGSIDNDMSSTDMTIGAASALERICEAVDAIESTALSHGRAFVIEVMGRHCGWLALQAAIATGADWLFVPERPIISDRGWDEVMISHLQKLKDLGQRRILVIVSEGAIDSECNPIAASDIKAVLREKLDLDTRITTLGHVQRGGVPCFLDRFLGTLQGAKAVRVLKKWNPDMESPLIGLSNNKVTVEPLMKAVELTKQVSKAIERKDFARAMELRDPDFERGFNAYMAMTKQTEHLFSSASAAAYHKHHKGDRGYKPKGTASGGRMRIGIMHVGAPAGAMNMATRVAALIAMNRGYEPYAIHNGWDGLLRHEVRRLWRADVWGWTAVGGSELGVNRVQVTQQNLPQIVQALRKLMLDGLIIIGGFEAFMSVVNLKHILAGRDSPHFVKGWNLTDEDSAYLGKLVVIQIPATISNNVPGTEQSLGSDTALNEIVRACDKIKQSARASRNRVFVMEVQGGNCGYLATMGALAGGATAVYIPEEGISLDRIGKDVMHLQAVYRSSLSRWGQASFGHPEPPSDERYHSRSDVFHIHDDAGGGGGDAASSSSNKITPKMSEGRIVVQNECASSVYKTHVVADILQREGKGLFDSRSIVLGHVQQGGTPSPQDRITATKFAFTAVDWITETQRLGGPSHAGLVAIRGATYCVRDVRPVYANETNVEKRCGKDPWWIAAKDLIPVLAKYNFCGTGG